MPKRKALDAAEEAEVSKVPILETKKSSRATKPVNYAEEVEGKPKRTKATKAATPAADKSSTYVKPDEVEVYDHVMPLPKKNQKGELVFPDFPQFRPNLTPREVLQLGSFGGTYFRPITSSVTGLSYKEVWKELPKVWLEGLDIKTQVASSTYNKSLNKYKETCGGDLEMWESSGWITSIDPYGWFMWYCRSALLSNSSFETLQTWLLVDCNGRSNSLQ